VSRTDTQSNLLEWNWKKSPYPFLSGRRRVIGREKALQDIFNRLPLLDTWEDSGTQLESGPDKLYRSVEDLSLCDLRMNTKCALTSSVSCGPVKFKDGRKL
jgi:hypothetical protein